MKNLKKLLYSWIDKRFLGGCSSYNSLKTRQSCRSKKQAREMFKQHDIPHAKGSIFYTPFGAWTFVRQHGFPVVIKPNVSGFSRGSHFPITTYAGLLKASILVKIWWPSSVVEQYLQGSNYRIVVVKNEIMSVIQRYPPFVIGDGLSTIGELIDRENEIRQKMGLYPVMHPIEKNNGIKRFLRKKGLALSSTPSKNEQVILYNRISLAPGGVVEIIDKQTIHPDNSELFLRILPMFNANILGVDAIFSKGISSSHKEQEVIFLEVNSRPYLRMHDFPRYGTKQDLKPYYAALDGLDVQEQDIF
jgi:D-alanine-D-alanine ligase-like ATP-grasp enzyme